MSRHIVEIAADRRMLRLNRGFLAVSEEDGAKVAEIPLDDIQAVIVSSPAAMLSTRVISALSSHGAPIVITGRNYLPSAIVLPLNGHGDTAGIQSDQIAASAAHRKRLWQQLVRAKINGQAWALRGHQETGDPDNRENVARHLDALQDRVRSGDPDNIEAQAARVYWTALLGADFRRDTDAGGHNAALNYGYAILRACVARACVAAGLNPALGVFHSNRHNPLCLVDDLMEPFRPVVDRTVAGFADEDLNELDPTIKRRLSALLDLDLPGKRGMSPVRQCALRLAQSVASGFSEARPDPDLPDLSAAGPLT